MQVSQFIFQPETGWMQTHGSDINPDVLLAFGSGNDCNGEILTDWWRTRFPQASLIGCSTAGEINGTAVSSNTMAITAIRFTDTPHKVASVNFEKGQDSYELAVELANSIPHEDLTFCLVLSDGLNINGSRLAQGLNDSLPESTLVTGGLAGDGKRFEETQTCHNDSYGQNRIVLLALYGNKLEVHSSSKGGWSAFGPKRKITKSKYNHLYELDGKSALELYKTYLGDYADELPSSGLRFPLEVTTESGEQFVRTLLAIDDDTGTMIFAGDLPEGAYTRFMHATYDRLIDGAQEAAHNIQQKTELAPELAILVSCVGRRLVLGQRAEEEIEAVNETLGGNTLLAGYYSYGELCPLENQANCTLHNQTMTITTLRENAHD